MPPVAINSFWTLLSFVLGTLGVTYSPSDNVKATVAAAAALLVAVIQWQQHRTIRHHTTAAASVAEARAAADMRPHPLPAPAAIDAHLAPGNTPAV